MGALIGNSRYPVYCNACQCVRKAVYQMSSANSSPVWLRCQDCGLFDVEAPFHRHGRQNGYGKLFADLYFTIEEAENEIAQWPSGLSEKGLMVIEWVKAQEGKAAE